MSQPIAAPKTVMQKFLDVVEKVGNKVPHPAVIFLILIAIVVVLSHDLAPAGNERHACHRGHSKSARRHDERWTTTVDETSQDRDERAVRAC